jgi:hypothetical protein
MDSLTTVLPFIIGGCVLTGLLVIFRSILGKSSKKKSMEQILQEVDDPKIPRCICGCPATHPMPRLERNRGSWDWLRSYFAMPPRYRRVIDTMGAYVLCKAHAHVADSMMDKFIFTDIRAHYASSNAELAIKAAMFEQEMLVEDLKECLTENQKRELKRNGNGASVHVLKNGTTNLSP